MTGHQEESVTGPNPGGSLQDEAGFVKISGSTSLVQTHHIMSGPDGTEYLILRAGKRKIRTVGLVP